MLLTEGGARWRQCVCVCLDALRVQKLLSPPRKQLFQLMKYVAYKTTTKKKKKTYAPVFIVYVKPILNITVKEKENYSNKPANKKRFFFSPAPICSNIFYNNQHSF